MTPANREGFHDVRILDNFYQTSSFFPMPVILVCTIAESGQMNLGPYSLCFPYSVAGGRSQMVFNTRDNSNTAINLRRTGLCTLNFIPDDRRYMRNSIFTIDSVLLKERWHRLLVEGKGRRRGRAAAFPPLPVDYGFLNNAHFWFTRHSPP